MGGLYNIVLWTIFGAMAVLVILNAPKVATLISTSGNIWLKETAQLTGTAYDYSGQSYSSKDFKMYG